MNLRRLAESFDRVVIGPDVYLTFILSNGYRDTGVPDYVEGPVTTLNERLPGWGQLPNIPC